MKKKGGTTKKRTTITTTKTTIKKSSTNQPNNNKASSNSTTQYQDMWEDPVFVSRQKEITQLSHDFSKAIDLLVVDKPLTVDPALLDNSEYDSSDYFDEEEEEGIIKTQKVGYKIQEQALLLMYEIDQMKKDTYRLISWFRPKAVKHNQKLMKMKNGLESLIDYLDSLRMRAEGLISV